MANQLNAKEYNIYSLMGNEFDFTIPEYQRPYSWTENEACTLFEDLVSFWEEEKDNKGATYFLGSVVLVKKDDKSPESEVIDGQQRLTTLSIIMSLLCGRTNKKKDITKCLWEEGIEFQDIDDRPRLQLRERDRAFFTQYVASENINELLERDPKKLDDDAQRLIQGNARLMQKRIDERLKNNEDVDSFIKCMLGQCFFVVVTTKDNESAFRIFSVLNNRGLSLLPSDILKARIIGAIDADKRTGYTDKWEEMEVELGREAFNKMLSHVRMIYAGTKLHGTLVSELESFIISPFKDKGKVIDNVIEPYSEAYKNVIECSFSASKYAENINESLMWMNKVDDADWIPAAMVVLKKYESNLEYVKEYLMALERMASFLYITSRTSNQRIERYAKSVDYLKKDEKEKALDVLTLTAGETEDFLRILDGEIYLMPSRKRSYVILRLDRYESDKAASYNNRIFSIEHVLPQNPAKGSQWMNDWPDEDIRSEWVHRIANLIPLTKKKNSQAQNFDFTEKKKKYFTEKNGVTSYALTTQIIAEDKWTPEIVQLRQKKILMAYAKLWNLYVDSSISDVNSAKKKTAMIEDSFGEIERQKNLLNDIKLFFESNPNTKLPLLPNLDQKAGQFVHEAIHDLAESDFELTTEQVHRLCTVEYSRKYTHRNLPFLIRVGTIEDSDKKLERYWKTKSYLETFNGEVYYVYSQWYPDHKACGDAHKSDFIQLYLDIALGQL